MGVRIHRNPQAYREYEIRVGREVLLPLLARWAWFPIGKRVLELGCAEGGLLDAFHDGGSHVAAVELDERRAAYAAKSSPYDLDVYVADITQPNLTQRIPGCWDLIVLRDVIEHIGDKQQAMRNIKTLLSPGGQLFMETAPWFMPFGGHQQVLDSPFRFVPWLHLLPRRSYRKFLLNVLKQQPALVEDLMSTYDCQITMRQLHRLIRGTGFSIEHERLYFINPAYRIRFGLPEIRWPFSSRFPLVPEVAATSVAMLLSAR
ncbi:MAG: class I SAM-dependent methyltransferase [bacterium]|nr:class I SAM-dependent methyltransferase [bacterium]